MDCPSDLSSLRSNCPFKLPWGLAIANHLFTPLTLAVLTTRHNLLQFLHQKSAFPWFLPGLIMTPMNNTMVATITLCLCPPHNWEFHVRSDSAYSFILSVRHIVPMC